MYILNFHHDVIQSMQSNHHALQFFSGCKMDSRTQYAQFFYLYFVFLFFCFLFFVCSEKNAHASSLFLRRLVARITGGARERQEMAE